MANTHYVSKPNRRPKNKNRKDYTRETMLKLRELHRADPATMSLNDFMDIAVRQHLKPLMVSDIREICNELRKQPDIFRRLTAEEAII